MRDKRRYYQGPSKNRQPYPAKAAILFYGEDWQGCKVYPYLFHFKQNVWKDFSGKLIPEGKRPEGLKAGQPAKLVK